MRYFINGKLVSQDVYEHIQIKKLEGLLKRDELINRIKEKYETYKQTQKETFKEDLMKLAKRLEEYDKLQKTELEERN